MPASPLAPFPLLSCFFSRTEGYRKVPYHYYEQGKDECNEYLLHEHAPHGGHRFITEKRVFAKWAEKHRIIFTHPNWTVSWCCLPWSRHCSSEDDSAGKVGPDHSLLAIWTRRSVGGAPVHSLLSGGSALRTALYDLPIEGQWHGSCDYRKTGRSSFKLAAQNSWQRHLEGDGCGLLKQGHSVCGQLHHLGKMADYQTLSQVIPSGYRYLATVSLREGRHLSLLPSSFHTSHS